MPSIHANEISRILGEVLGTPLNSAEQLKCEELVLNVYPGAVKRWIKAWARALNRKEGKVLTFGHFYAPIMNGIIVGGMKCKREHMFKFDTPTKRMIYAAMHTYLGTNFPMRELEDVVWFTKCTTLAELQAATTIAQHHGIVSAAYVRAIIVGNRRRAAALLRAKDAKFAKVTDEPPDIVTGVPDVKSLQDAWTRRLRDAYDKQAGKDVERSAKRKLLI